MKIIVVNPLLFVWQLLCIFQPSSKT